MRHGHHTRRTFLQASGLVTSGLALGSLSFSALGQDSPPGKLKLLVLGGTGFIGPHIVREAVDRGHEVTLFNRGRTNVDLFPKLEKLEGNRDPNIDDGLKSISDEIAKGREWDGVIDTSGYVPRIVSASAGLLADHARQYVFVSSISVYADPSKKGLAEDDPVGTIDDPTIERITNQTYGPLKALCENATERAFAGRATIVRPGFIAGPRDPYPNRFHLWVMRANGGGAIAAPGQPNDPVQYIDARDLAAFIIRSIETKTYGVFNLVGPDEPLTIAEMIAGLAEGTSSTLDPVWIPASFLDEHQMGGWFIPWINPESTMGGMGQVSNERARRAGLNTRSVATSARDTLSYLMEPDNDMRKRVQQLIDAGREKDLITAWNART